MSRSSVSLSAIEDGGFGVAFVASVAGAMAEFRTASVTYGVLLAAAAVAFAIAWHLRRRRR